MDQIIRITSSTAHNTPEGMRLSVSYSVIDEEGKLLKSNERFTCLVLDDEILTAISTVNDWLLAKIPQ